MKARYFLFMLSLILFIACESKVKYKEPDNLIPREQMINLLIDMHIANGTTGARDKTDDEMERNYMSLVYDKYQIDSTRFAESNFYYVSNIDEYESIFKEVQERLQVIHDQYLLVEPPESERALDSILEKTKIRKKSGGVEIYE